jgi:hypothetical protein
LGNIRVENAAKYRHRETSDSASEQGDERSPDIPKNMTPIFLPSRSPELNPVENGRQYLRANWLSNRVFETYDDIIDAACDIWKKTSSIDLQSSPQSACAIGRTSVTHKGRWYYSFLATHSNIRERISFVRNLAANLASIRVSHS